MSLYHSPGIVTNGLVMYLDAANLKSHSQSGGTAWSDPVGGYHCTQVGAAIFNSGVINFSGAYAIGTNIPAVFESSSDFSQTAWFRKSGDALESPGWRSVFSAHTGTAGGYRYLMTFGNGTSNAGYNSIGLNQVGVAATGVFLDIGTHTDRWLNATITKSGSQISIYCFNSGTLLKLTETIFWNISASTGYLVGRHWLGGVVVPFSGAIATISVYNRALTEGEVIQNYNALRGRFGV